MIESIEELRKICQPKALVENEIWYYRGVRKISIYLTRLMLNANIAANQITLSSMLLPLMGGLLLTFGDYWYSIFGGLLLNLYCVLDCVDGEVARYQMYKHMRTKSASFLGLSLERISHFTTGPFVFMCTSFGVYNNLQDIRVLLSGFSMSFSFMLFWFCDLLFIRFNEVRSVQAPVHKSTAATRMLFKIFEHRVIRTWAWGFYVAATIFFLILVTAALNYLYVVLFFYGVTLPFLVVAYVCYSIVAIKAATRNSSDHP